MREFSVTELPLISVEFRFVLYLDANIAKRWTRAYFGVRRKIVPEFGLARPELAPRSRDGVKYKRIPLRSAPMRGGGVGSIFATTYDDRLGVGAPDSREESPSPGIHTGEGIRTSGRWERGGRAARRGRR